MIDELEMLRRAIRVQLLNHEIGNARIELKGRRSCNGTGADVRLIGNRQSARARNREPAM
jgi:hypothetical protein